MDSVIATATAYVALIASVLGVISVFDQLTRGPRLRRRAEFLRGTIEAEPEGSAQRSVLGSLHRDIIARLVAEDAISTWAVLSGVLVMLIGVAISTFAGVVIGTMRAGGLSPSAGRVFLAAFLVVLSFAVWAIGWSATLTLLKQRVDIAEDYMAGTLPLLRPSPVDPRRWLRHGPGRVLVAGLSVGYLVLFTGVGYAMSWSDLASGTCFIGTGLFILLLFHLGASRFMKGEQWGVWQHPRTPTDSMEGRPAGRWG